MKNVIVLGFILFGSLSLQAKDIVYNINGSEYIVSVDGISINNNFDTYYNESTQVLTHNTRQLNHRHLFH